MKGIKQLPPKQFFHFIEELSIGDLFRSLIFNKDQECEID